VSKQNPALPSGTWIYRNWNAQIKGAPEEFAEELPLYSDARFTGELRTELGPYLLLNTIPDPHDPGTVVPALVLRVSQHLSEDSQQIVEAFRVGVPDATAFTGGTPYDEFASLAALALRARIAIGTATRWFRLGDTDGRGSPRHSGGTPPTLPQSRLREAIPILKRSVALSAELLQTYPQIQWQTAVELARAARSYRQAIWVSNGDGNLAWLLLVSAAETAATEWARLNKVPSLTPTELLLQNVPDYAKRLTEAAGENAAAVLAEVGKTQSDVLRARWKFREFLLTFGLDAPTPRPKASPVEWTPEGMRKVLNQVYTYRSLALHLSIPFPPPMYDPPFLGEGSEDNSQAWAERPGGAVHTTGGLWVEGDLPINLYAFHHLVATALQNWWRSLT
jgi:hypothetical protein